MDDTVSSPAARCIRLTVPASGATGRLDKVLTDLLAQESLSVSRTRLKALLSEGAVALASPAGARTIEDANRKVKPGEIYEVTIPAPAPAKPVAQSIPLTVVHEDADLIVIDKPAGLVVHPAAGNPDRTLVNALIAHCGESLSGIGGEARPGIVHRLDKDTSGLMVVAKTDLAHHGLAEQFAIHGRDGRLRRAYQALVWGVPKERRFSVIGNIGRSSSNRKKMTVVSTGGKPATTHVEIVKIYHGLLSLVECRLETGRTHQIRVHLSHSSYPLVGDPFYGRAKRGIVPRTKGEHRALLAALRAFPRQALHAIELGFEHPISGRKLRFRSALPEDMADLIGMLEAGG